MKKQSGFTLIELLLVLAIIGIISAIAIPALLAQRARARDKAAISNTVGRVDDLVGQFDKFHEAGLGNASIQTKLNSYLKATTGRDKNPWHASVAAYASIDYTQTAALTKSAFENALTTGSMGQAKMAAQLPSTANSGRGFLGGAVLVQNKINNSTTVRKSVAIE